MPVVSAEHVNKRKAQVLLAARQCFLKRGIHETTMRDIIEKSGLSAGAIYNYFPSKESIIRSLIATRQSSEAARVEKAQNTHRDPVKALLDIGELYFNQLDKRGDLNERKLNLLFWAEGVTDPDIRKMTRSGFAQPSEYISELVSRLAEDGRLIPGITVDGLSRLITASYHGYVLQRIWNVAPTTRDYLTNIKAILNAVVVPVADRATT